MWLHFQSGGRDAFEKKHFEKLCSKYFIFQVTQPGLQGMCASGRFEQGSSTAWGWQEQQAQVGEIVQDDAP